MLKISSLVSFLKIFRKIFKRRKENGYRLCLAPYRGWTKENTVEALPLTPVYSGILGCLDCFKCD